MLGGDVLPLRTDVHNLCWSVGVLGRIEKSDTGFGKLAVKFGVALLDFYVLFTLSLLIFSTIKGQEEIFFRFTFLQKPKTNLNFFNFQNNNNNNNNTFPGHVSLLPCL
jgi:hypothetical protein